MKRKIILTLAAIYLLFLACASYSQDRPVRVAVAAPSVAFLPLWVAKEAGIFKKQQVPVELLFIGSSPIALAALVSDEIDIQSGSRVGVANYLQGYKELVFFATLDYRFPFKVYSQPSIASMSELRGKKFGVTRIGGELDFASRYILKQSGLDPNRDLTFIQLGTTPNILAALKARSIDAGTLSIPQNFVADKMGLRALADLTQIGPRYTTTAFLAKRQFLARNHERMEAFIRAMVEAVYYIKTHRPEAIRILSQYTRITDREILDSAYDMYVKIWMRAPEIHREDLQLIVESLAETNPKAREIDLDDLIYGRLIENVIKSGFVERVYR